MASHCPSAMRHLPWSSFGILVALTGAGLDDWRRLQGPLIEGLMGSSGQAKSAGRVPLQVLAHARAVFAAEPLREVLLAALHDVAIIDYSAVVVLVVLVPRMPLRQESMLEARFQLSVAALSVLLMDGRLPL